MLAIDEDPDVSVDDLKMSFERFDAEALSFKTICQYVKQSEGLLR